MNRTLLLAGGFVLVAGGLAYWYLSQRKCYTGATKCIGPDLYRCQDGQWVMFEQNSSQCVDGGGSCELVMRECTPDLEGLHLCSLNNLCKCSNGTWRCIEQNSLNCKYPFIYHHKCFNERGIAECEETYIEGEDECELFGEYCSCQIANCQESCFCAQDNRCIKKALYRYYEEEQLPPNCDTGPYEHWLEIPLEKPWAIGKILNHGKIFYDCANPLVDIINWSLWAEYNGQSTKLVDGWYSSSGQSGWFYISENVINFTPQAVDKLLVNCSSIYSNVIPTKAYMTISFV